MEREKYGTQNWTNGFMVFQMVKYLRCFGYLDDTHCEWRRRNWGIGKASKAETHAGFFIKWTASSSTEVWTSRKNNENFKFWWQFGFQCKALAPECVEIMKAFQMYWLLKLAFYCVVKTFSICVHLIRFSIQFSHWWKASSLLLSPDAFNTIKWINELVNCQDKNTENVI